MDCNCRSGSCNDWDETSSTASTSTSHQTSLTAKPVEKTITAFNMYYAPRTSTREPPNTAKPCLVELLINLDIANRLELIRILERCQSGDRSSSEYKESHIVIMIALRYIIETTTLREMTSTVVSGSAICNLSQKGLTILKKSHKHGLIKNDDLVRMIVSAIFGNCKFEVRIITQTILSFVFNNECFNELVKSAIIIDAVDEFYVCSVLYLQPTTLLEMAYQKCLYHKFNSYCSQKIQTMDTDLYSILPQREMESSSGRLRRSCSMESFYSACASSICSDSNDTYVTAPIWDNDSSDEAESKWQMPEFIKKSIYNSRKFTKYINRSNWMKLRCTAQSENRRPAIALRRIGSCDTFYTISGSAIDSLPVPKCRSQGSFSTKLGRKIWSFLTTNTQQLLKM